MKPRTVVAAAALVLAFSSSGSAKEPLTIVEMIDHLEEAVRDCDWKARNLTGAPKNNMLLHKRIMDDVLGRLKEGREIDLKKLEEALKVHPS